MIPGELRWWASRPGGAEWLAVLPRLVGECAAQWELAIGEPFAPASVAWVAPAPRRADGSPVVLKVNFPDDESAHEPDALTFWDGAGAARLLAHDRQRNALLIERCEPGTQLWQVADDEEAVEITAGVLEQLWRPAPVAPAAAPFAHLIDEAARWAHTVPQRWERLGRPWPHELTHEAVALCHELTTDPPSPSVLCHQDAHGGNTLRRGDDWAAIDPKPLIGEPAFDLASALRDRREWLLAQPDPQAIVRRRLDFYSERLDLDRTRVRGWGIIHALAWGADDHGADEAMIACAQLIAAA